MENKTDSEMKARLYATPLHSNSYMQSMELPADPVWAGLQFVPAPANPKTRLWPAFDPLRAANGTAS